MQHSTLQNASAWEECTKRRQVRVSTVGKTERPSRQTEEIFRGRDFRRQLGWCWSASCHVGKGIVTCVQGKAVCTFYL